MSIIIKIEQMSLSIKENDLYNKEIMCNDHRGYSGAMYNTFMCEHEADL